jgi:hypothetical protein
MLGRALLTAREGGWLFPHDGKIGDKENNRMQQISVVRARHRRRRLSTLG